MKKMFPTMLDAPEGRVIVSGVSYWIFAFFLIPFMISLATVTSRGQEYEIWLDIGCHTLNFVFAAFLFFFYLKDAFLMAQAKPGAVFGTAFLCAVIITVLKLVISLVTTLVEKGIAATAAFGSLVTTEMDLLFFATAVIGEQPIWGTLCLCLLAPLTTSCLLYATVFAPIGVRRPWIAYLVMAAVLLLQRLVMTLCLFPLEEELAIYLVNLPVHLIACWAYQKTDTVWTPILAHILSNFVLAFLVLGVASVM